MQLVDRALNALEILSRNMDGFSVTELAKQLGIPVSSTHRVLASLKGNELVEQDKHTKKYRPSYKICGIASNILKGSGLVQNGKTPIRALAEKIDRKVDLCVMEHGVVRNVVSSDCGAPVQYMEQSELEIPDCAAAAGQVFKAYQNEAQDAVDLASIRSQGYAVADGEKTYMHAAACPIFDRYGDVVAALAFTSIKDGNAKGMAERIGQMKECAGQIALVLR